MRFLFQFSVLLFGLMLMTACGGGGSSSPAPANTDTNTNTNTTGSAPSAPLSVRANGGNGQFSVTWMGSTGASSYNIYYGTAPNVSKSSGTQIVNASSGHVVSGLANGKTYYVVVTALNSYGESAVSSEMPVNVVAPPSAPTGLTATAADSQVTLNWTTVSGSAYYTVYYSTTPGVDVKTATSRGMWPGNVLTALTNGTTYYFVVVATNASGKGAISAEVSATPTQAGAAPNAPAGVTADTGGSGTAVLRWAPVPGATQYKAYYKANSTGVTSTVNDGVFSGIRPGTSLIGLTDGTAYYFVVTAVNAIGESLISNEVSVIPSAQMGGGIQNQLAFAASATVTTATNGTGGYSTPVGMTSDGTNIYFADKGTGHLFKMVTATNAVTSFSSLPCACEIADLTTDGKALYVLANSDTDGDKIYKVDMLGNATVFVGSGRSFADLQGTSAAFNAPQGITTNGIYLYVSDTGNNLIREVEIATANVRTIAGDDMNLQPGRADGVHSRFNAPRGITTDGTDIYVADAGNNSIRRLSLISIITVDTIAGDLTGIAGSTDGNGASARFSGPTGITTDGQNLYVADTGNHKIRMIAAPIWKGSTVSTLAGSSQGFGDGIGGLFSQPGAITTDGRSLFVVDSGNAAIRKLQ